MLYYYDLCSIIIDSGEPFGEALLTNLIHIDDFSDVLRLELHLHLLYSGSMNNRDEQLSNACKQQIKTAATINFSSAADDFVSGKLDLNQHLIRHPASTFFFRASGDSMRGAGILDGDLLIIDKSLAPKNNSIVVATLDGEFVVRRLRVNNGKMFLCLPNGSHQTGSSTNNEGVQIWGVVTHAVHDVRPT